MKKRIGILFLLMTMIATFVFAAYPEDLENQELEDLQTTTSDGAEVGIDPISLETGEENNLNITDNDVYLCENNVNIKDVINGNVYVIAQNATIDQAMIYGNVYIIAEKINILNAEINGSVYVIGKTIYFSGSAYDVYSCGSKVDFDTESYVLRDIRAVADTVNLKGNVFRNVYAGVNQLTVAENAIIHGTLDYSSEKEEMLPEGAQIGDVKFHLTETKERGYEDENYVLEAFTVAFKTLIVALILIFVVTKFKNLNRTENVGMDLLKDTGKGLLAFVIFPIVIMLLLISILGTGLGVVTLFLYMVILYVSKALAAVEIANQILCKMKTETHQNAKLIGISILVSLVIWGVSLIPTFGGLVQIVVGLIGLGVFASLIIQRNKKEIQNEN